MSSYSNCRNLGLNNRILGFQARDDFLNEFLYQSFTYQNRNKWIQKLTTISMVIIGIWQFAKQSYLVQGVCMNRRKNKNKCPHCGHLLCLRTEEVLSWDVLETGAVSTDNHSVARKNAYLHCGDCGKTSLDDLSLKRFYTDLDLEKRFLD